MATTVPGPPMTEEDIFNSQTVAGLIGYRLPSIPYLFNLPEEKFDHYQTMTFWVSVVAHIDPVDTTLACKEKNNCKILYRRSYTPTIYHIAPRVTYYESETEVWFDPASTMSLIKDLETDELPFINAKIGDNLIDFENGGTTSTSYFSGWSKNGVRGQIGENSIGKNQNVTMMWETGNAAVATQQATFCNFD